MEYVPLRFKEKKERLVFAGGGIGLSVTALSCICGHRKCGSVTDSDLDGGADPNGVSGKDTVSLFHNAGIFQSALRKDNGNIR